MARGGAKNIESYSIACQDCTSLWSGGPKDQGWVSAYSAAQRHARQQGHRLAVHQHRTWTLESAGYDGETNG